VEVRVDDETRARWVEAAAAARVSLSEFVRDAVEARLSSPSSDEEPHFPRAARPERQSPPRPAPAAGGRKPFRPDFGGKIK